MFDFFGFGVGFVFVAKHSLRKSTFAAIKCVVVVVAWSTFVWYYFSRLGRVAVVGIGRLTTSHGVLLFGLLLLHVGWWYM